MIHIVPIDDRLPHDLSIDCLCDPTVEYIDQQTGTPHNRPLVIHDAFDGRVKSERQGKPTSKKWQVIDDRSEDKPEDETNVTEE